MPHSEVLQTEEKTATYEVPGNKIDGGLICKNANFILDHGLNSSANFAILDVSNRDLECSRRIAVGNIGANFNISSSYGWKWDVGVDADLVRATYEGENFKVGTGLSYSTGVSWQDGIKKLHIFGYGFEYDHEGFGLKVPIFDIKYKWW